eukprot:3200580-Amphidinium_carterae.1
MVPICCAPVPNSACERVRDLGRPSANTAAAVIKDECASNSTSGRARGKRFGVWRHRAVR